MTLDTVIVARLTYRHQGEMAQGLLLDAGIPAALFIDDAGGMDAALSFVNPARLVVRIEHAEEARELLVDAGILDDETAGEDLPVPPPGAHVPEGEG